MKHLHLLYLFMCIIFATALDAQKTISKSYQLSDGIDKVIISNINGNVTASGHQGTHWPGSPRAPLPDGTHQAGGQSGEVDSHPG